MACERLDRAVERTGTVVGLEGEGDPPVAVLAELRPIRDRHEPRVGLGVVADIRRQNDETVQRGRELARDRGLGRLGVARHLGRRIGGRPRGDRLRLRLLPGVRELSEKLGAKPGADVVVYFTSSRAELERRFEALKATLNPADGLWIAWPKKAAKLKTDLDFDAVQQTGLAHGLVDNKSCAIDERWQALRFVYRLADRPQE